MGDDKDIRERYTWELGKKKPELLIFLQRAATAWLGTYVPCSSVGDERTVLNSYWELKCVCRMAALLGTYN